MIFRLLLCALAALLPLRAADPLVLEGGLSPNKKWDIVVLEDVKTEDLDSVDKRLQVAYLRDAATKKIIGPLEDVTVNGGGFGNTFYNTIIDWSPDSQYFAANMRVGRKIYDFNIHEMTPKGGARLMKLLPLDIPKWVKAEAKITTDANPGKKFLEWRKKGGFIAIEWGWIPKEPDGPIDPVYAESTVQKEYQLTPKGWKIIAVRADSDHGPE